jgi:hypothetical protein
MSYKIDKGIPMPVPTGSPCKYPFKDMVVGDSFLVPEADAKNLHARIQSRANHLRASIRGYKLAVRRVDGGRRVWRIS